MKVEQRSGSPKGGSWESVKNLPLHKSYFDSPGQARCLRTSVKTPDWAGAPTPARGASNLDLFIEVEVRVAEEDEVVDFYPTYDVWHSLVS